jgi:hypothetical protein
MKTFPMIFVAAIVPSIAFAAGPEISKDRTEKDKKLVQHAAEGSRIELTPGLEQSYFCAICEPVAAGDYAKPLAEKYPQLEVFRLQPVIIYWGSFKQAESSLRLHPVAKGEGRCKVLVVLRSENNLGPGDWYKSYIPIQKDSRSPKYYLLSGEGTVSGTEIEKILERYAKAMQQKFPLDKKSPCSKTGSKTNNGEPVDATARSPVVEPTSTAPTHHL